MTLKKLGGITAASIVMLASAIWFANLLLDDNSMELGVGKAEYTVNGNVKKFDTETENIPFIDRSTDTLMLPLRCVIEEMGGSVSWEEDTNTTLVTYKNTKMRLSSDTNEAQINGYDIYLYHKPISISGCLYVSSDFIADNFSTTVQWDEGNNQIVISSTTEEKPVINFNVVSFADDVVEYSIDVPVITGLNDKRYEKELNEALFDSAAEQMKEFSIGAGVEAEESTSRMTAQWSRSGSCIYRSKELISIKISDTIKSQESGLDTHLSYINIDLQTQSFMTLNDVFKNDGYQQTILEAIQQEIEQNADSYSLKDVSELELGINTIFGFEKEEMVFSFYDAQDNISTFRIPYTELKEELKTSFGFLYLS